jgi:acyl-CoA synthetase (AMP-forming)/AMP-acid ligase II
VRSGRNGPGYPQVLFAAAAAGVPFAPLNYRLSAGQLHELLAGLAGSLVVADAEYLPVLEGQSAEVISTSDAKISPVTVTVTADAARSLALFGAPTSLGAAAAWTGGLLAVFIPLSVWRYRRMS